MCMCEFIPCVCASAQGSQKRVLGSLKLELQTAVRLDVGARDQTPQLCKNNTHTLALSHLSISLGYVLVLIM